MFTGLIEEIGELAGREISASGLKLEIYARKVLEETKRGDSICVDGVCLTVTEIAGDRFKVEAVKETVARTTISGWHLGKKVNLERALALKDRLGGHFVLGHIDGIGTVRALHRADLNTILEMECEPEIMKYIVHKGSIAINGISLTVAEVNSEAFNIAVIPFTWRNTNLQYCRIGDNLNLETDILAKYIEKMIIGTRKAENLTEDFLRKAGF